MEPYESLIHKLNARRFDAYFASNSEEAVRLALSFLHPEDTVAFGGSMSLYESGMLEALRKPGVCRLLDRDKATSPEERKAIMREGIMADYYFASVNALCEDGTLYQVDGTGNRVAAIMFAAKNVILIVGKNKIFPTEEACLKHIDEVAAPNNAKRLKKNTPCVSLGHCVDCLSQDCICANRVKMRISASPKRIKIILVDEVLGY
ncbi:MAG: lactate utilization protein [Bacilli bacterium]|nr:lactate utilization protein [Bacilli bacterium]